MTLGEIAQTITAIAALVGAINSLINGRRIKKVEHATNGLTDRLVNSTAKASLEQGRREGLKEGRDE